MDAEDQVKKYFDWIDYMVFAIMLIVSALVGVYFAFFAKIKQNTTSEYLMGGKTMGIFPISMSLIASYISGISLLGIPAEMYTYGTQFWMTLVSEVFVAIIMGYAILPVFYQLKITSTYEYLNLRFSNTVRMLGTIMFLAKMLLYIPIVIYVPALAFSQGKYSIECPSHCPIMVRKSPELKSMPGIKAMKMTKAVKEGLSSRRNGEITISSGSRTEAMRAIISIISISSSSSGSA
ncbi:hypothetical protein HUJ05_005597 [Dendroctonus ponderosae]|nr:hypothetical protein HUJ05_005597 [Dendroctonus ponderosae]